jgi:hypothetical protein
MPPVRAKARMSGHGRGQSPWSLFLLLFPSFTFPESLDLAGDVVKACIAEQIHAHELQRTTLGDGHLQAVYFVIKWSTMDADSTTSRTRVLDDPK